MENNKKIHSIFCTPASAVIACGLMHMIWKCMKCNDECDSFVHPYIPRISISVKLLCSSMRATRQARPWREQPSRKIADMLARIL